MDYNYQVRASWIPNDYRFKTQQWGPYEIQAPGAWDTARGQSWVRIAVVDSGIASSHPDIKGKVVDQRDFVNNNVYAQDDDGHGTHVAGIAASVTNNVHGVAGTCPSCTLLSAKVLDADGASYMDHIAQGITWSANCGLGSSTFPCGPSTTALYNAVNYAFNRGAVIVAAAGNENTSSTRYNYPAAYGNVIAVAATDAYDRRAYCSNYGSWIDVAAPGTSIISTLPGSYGAESGTSMATPHVAGLAGLLFGQGRYTRDQVRGRITGTSTNLGTPGHDHYYGYGCINVANAVR